MRRPSRLLTVLAAVVMVAGAGVLAAPTASATPSPQSVSVQPAAGAGQACTSSDIGFVAGGSPVTTITGTAGTLYLTNNCSNALYYLVSPGGTRYIMNGGNPGGTPWLSLTATTTTVEVFQNASGGTAWATLTINFSGGGGGGGSSEVSSSESVSVPAALTLDVNASAGGASCKEGSSVTGYTGEWLTLPASGDCTLPSKPGAVLLGWSTSADFPVAIAQRQATNKWGTYELTDAAGVVTATFIPAGWQTFVSGPNTLHPIWSN